MPPPAAAEQWFLGSAWSRPLTVSIMADLFLFGRTPPMQVHELLTFAVPQLAPNTTLATALIVLREEAHGVGLVAANGTLMGLLTDRDIAAGVANGRLQRPVSEVMSRPPPMLQSDASLAEAIVMVRERGHAWLPVADAYGLLLGAVSSTDLLTAYIKHAMKPTTEGESGGNHWLALEDSLTGLPNRRAMELDLRQAEAMARRREEPLTLAIVALDGDHDDDGEARDARVRILADLLKRRIRASDKLFRYGSESFVYLLPATPLEGARIAVDRLREAVALSATLTCSAGVAMVRGGAWQVVLQQAEVALTQAHQRGGNQVVCGA